MLQHPCPGARRTNPFGSRTVNYSAFGLTSHNGEDFAGGDTARAMATGVVERVGDDPGGYGNYVTLRHDWQGGQRYRTRYAHLARTYAREGDILQQGDALGQVGATGNTTGPHLHAEFEPGMVVADGLKGRRAFWHMLEGGAMQLGFHIGNEGSITDIDWQILEAVKPGYVTLLPNYGMHGQPIGRRDVNCILTINPACHFVLRPYLPGTAVSTSIAEFGNAVDRLLDEWSDWVPAGQKHLQLFNEPNMPISARDWEGFGDQLADMMRYNETWLGLVRRLRANHPDWLYGWGPLTIGNRDVWFPGDPVGHYYLHGPAGCQASLTAAQLGEAMRTGPCYASLMEADEFYAHVYIHRIPENTHDGRVNFGDPAIGLRHERLQLFLPRPMPTVITEAGYPNTAQWPTWAGPALLDWLDILHTRNNVSGVCLWILGEHWGGMWYSGGAPRAEVGQLAQWQCAHSGVPMTDAELERILGDELQLYIVPLNPDAALEKAAARRGLLPASDEVRKAVGGAVWVAQAFRKPTDALTTQHLVRTREGEWAEGDMRWWIRNN